MRAMLSIGLAVALLGCGDTEVIDAGEGPGGKGPVSGKADSSIDAVFVDFEWDGELVVTSSWSHAKTIESQLLFTIGQLNGDKSVGRLDKVELTNVVSEDADGKRRITYHARMPVAWGKQGSSAEGVPETYTLILPRDLDQAAQQTFAENYGHDCVDWGAHDVDAGTMWYYYRPARSGCSIDEGDVHRFTATVSVSEINTTGKYPEYHQVWQDGVLEVVAIYGKFEHGATSNSDAGISSYNEYVSKVQQLLAPYQPTTTPAELPSKPGVDVPDVTIEATLPDGKTVRVVVLLVDGVQSPGPDFDDRYETLSATADLIAYNGHSGLGANIRALAKKGKWETGQYVIVFMNGCDTYAYVDSALADAHMAVNDDDPEGTKYLDVVTNALPAPAYYSAGNTLALTEALLRHESPKTYEAIFAEFNRSQVVLVSGEQDNVFYPGMTDGEQPGAWAGLSESGSVAKDEDRRYETPVLPEGAYLFTLSGSGDADLYVRAGGAPESDLWDCRPYKYGTQEECTIQLGAPAAVHIMVRGWDPTSEFTLEGKLAAE